MPTAARAPVADTDEAETYLRQHAIGDHMLMFARALAEADSFAGKIENFLYFLEKPWKWAWEFGVWDQKGRPLDDSEPGWQAFLEAVEGGDVAR